MRMMKYVNKFNRSVTRVQEILKDNGNPPAENATYRPDPIEKFLISDIIKNF